MSGAARPPDGSPIRWRLLLSAGAVRAPEFAIAAGGGLRCVWLPSLFAVMEHEREGIGLFDTGYARRFFQATATWPCCLYRRVTHVRVAPGESAVRQLAARGISAEQVRWIVVSHFDPDHICGLRDFPAARLLCTASAHRSIAGKHGMAALRTRILPGLLPDDFEQRMALLPGMAGPPIGPFPASLDLFGDGSVRLVDLPGHAEGQVGAFVRGADGVEWFLAADACWSRTTIFSDERRPPHLWLHRAIAVDRALQELTYARLRDLRRSHPRVEIIPSHCRAAAAALLSGKNAWRD